MRVSMVARVSGVSEDFTCPRLSPRSFSMKK